LTEYKIQRDNVYAIGIECYGKVDVEKLRQRGIEGILGAENENGTLIVHTLYGDESVPAMDVYAERCTTASRRSMWLRRLIGVDGEVLESNRFDQSKAGEDDGRRESIREAAQPLHPLQCLQKRLPGLTCENAYLTSGLRIQNGLPASASRKICFIISRVHVAALHDCGECSRVCPESIPLHLLNRKFTRITTNCTVNHAARKSAR
jgi:hypothetical protein